MSKSYSELMTIHDFIGRFNYLKIGGSAGKETFGSDRILNQMLYRSPEWKAFRNEIILRDKGCDLACPGREIHGRLIIHHINPITADDILERRFCVFDPENVITTYFMTHEAIHFGSKDLLAQDPIERKPNDTIPWR